MGLKFRGFKAKLFGKSKKTNANEVVCLGYRIHTDSFEANAVATYNVNTDRTQDVGPTEVVKQRRPTVHPVVHTIFKPDGQKHVLTNPTDSTSPPKDISDQPPKASVNENEKISTLIHMTANHDSDYTTHRGGRDEHEYTEADFQVQYNRERQMSSDSCDSEENERDTASVSSADMYSSHAASIFLSSEKKNRASNESQASQTSA